MPTAPVELQQPVPLSRSQYWLISVAVGNVDGTCAARLLSVLPPDDPADIDDTCPALQMYGAPKMETVSPRRYLVELAHGLH